MRKKTRFQILGPFMQICVSWLEVTKSILVETILLHFHFQTTESVEEILVCRRFSTKSLL